MLADYDVVIVGAGLSGIDAAYRLQQHHPARSYTILEAREDLGGTWDLFRYPGIRSDSDLYTFGFPFSPWHDGQSLADGSRIKEYIRTTAARYGIDERIQYSSPVHAADFSTATGLWTLTVADGRTMTCRFLHSCAGYYDYERPHDPEIPGIDDFAGTVVHPQFWPPDLDYRDKRVVVIGSGATAVTLVPAMAPDAAHITMLQRSPTWIAALPRRDPLADLARRWLPPRVAHRLVRAKNITLSTAFYQFSRRRPRRAAALLHRLAVRELGDEEVVRRHFTPDYDVWDQRVCVAADGDFFAAVRSGRAEVVTDLVDRFVPQGVLLASGRVLPADIVVTATGLRLRPGGGIEATVDGQPVELSDQFVLLGAMLTGMPNYAFSVGYTNASWTLRADLTSRLVCRVLEWMDDRGYDWVVPHAPAGMPRRPLMDLTSGYIVRARDMLPQQGPRAPWRMRQNYVLDAVTTLRTNLGRHLQGHRLPGHKHVHRHWTSHRVGDVG